MSVSRKIFYRAASIFCVVALFFLILTASIGLPIYCRAFYYAHIGALDLPENTGFSAEEIRVAYDEVLDYLTLPGREFSAGGMGFSAEGAAHFADCKALFDLNAGVLIGSAVCLAVLWGLRKGLNLPKFTIGRHTSGCYAGIFAVVLPVILGGLAALDFERAFEIFHGIFFPGKSNWLFDPAIDQIIQVMPMEFFRNCGIFIGCGVVIFSGILLIRDYLFCKKNNESGGKL